MNPSRPNRVDGAKVAARLGQVVQLGAHASLRRPARRATGLERAAEDPSWWVQLSVFSLLVSYFAQMWLPDDRGRRGGLESRGVLPPMGPILPIRAPSVSDVASVLKSSSSLVRARLHGSACTRCTGLMPTHVVYPLARSSAW